MKMKYLSFIPLFLALVVCVYCDEEVVVPSSCSPDYCTNGGVCNVRNEKACCTCPRGRKGRICEIDSSNDPPVSSVPHGCELVPETDMDKRNLIDLKRCHGFSNPNGNPPGCGIGTGSLQFLYSGPFWQVYIWADVVCCCYACQGGGPSPVVPQGPFCREVFPNLGIIPVINVDSSILCPPQF